MEISLTTPIQYLPRVGPNIATKLERLGIKTVNDLLMYPPFRYNDYSLVSPISHVQPGETVTIKGTVESIKNFITKTGKRIQEAVVADESGKLYLVWFNQPYLTRVIYQGANIHASGTVSWFGRKMAIMSAEYELLEAQNPGLHTGRLVPVYSETEGVTSKWLRARIAYLFELGLHNVQEYLPEDFRVSHKLPSIDQALQYIHYPNNMEEATLGRLRLSFDEFLFMQILAVREKHLWDTTQHAVSIRLSKAAKDAFTSLLPFALTHDQLLAISDILHDMERPIPMNRLIEGDVGSGKTVVAALAMYAVALTGRQSILMAPTQILAEQHFQTINTLLSPYKINVDLVTSQKKGRGDDLFGKQSVLVGTHALLSSTISFENVGLIVIDEQQRFGVNQRKLLRDKAESKKTPHLLTMTATPIPRTIALTLYGNLDLSVINQMPKGRSKIKTWVVPKEKRAAAYSWIQKQLLENSAQAFIVCPFIEESESLSTIKAATSEFERLKKDVFTSLRLALLHGRLKPKEKNAVLDAFRSKTIDILVTTPVVEVGIDIPDATVMVIEAAERFGLAQLHQLRGRVGRSTKESYCLLFTEVEEEKVIGRIKSLETTHSGPLLAEIDLKLRGPGELFGTRQHGLPALKYATFSNIELISETHEAASRLVHDDPELARFPLLREKLKESKIETAIED